MSTQRYTPECKEEAVRQAVERGSRSRGCGPAWLAGATSTSTGVSDWSPTRACTDRFIVEIPSCMSVVSRRAVAVVCAEPPLAVDAELAPCNGTLPCVTSTAAGSSPPASPSKV